jgi:transcriptional regulator of heat shock response
MDLTQRQKRILDIIIEEYINFALPVSSRLLEKKYNLGVCPATIRAEMQKLSDKGYIRQPHTSAGRVPTNKGYRLFVNELLESNYDNFDSIFLNQIRKMGREFSDSLRFAQNLTKRISELTSNLALSYLPEEGFVLKEGWEEIIKEPEFETTDYFSKFVEMVKNWEENIESLEIPQKIQIYIGKENPVSKNKDFSVIVAKCYFPKDTFWFQENRSESSKRRKGTAAGRCGTKKEKCALAILGPTRMDYGRNIVLINSLTKIMENID